LESENLISLSNFGVRASLFLPRCVKSF